MKLHIIEEGANIKYVKRSKYSFHDLSAKQAPSAILIKSKT